MSTEFEVQGFDSLMAKIESMGKAGDKIYDKALTDGAEPILKDIKGTTTFKDDTGKARRSFKISRVKKNKDGKYVWVGDVDGVAKYTWYLEHKHPFMRPSYQEHKKEIFEIIKQSIAEGIDNG